MTTPEAATAGKVLHGTCGWSDASLQQCGRFYAANIRSAVDRLPTYSRHFPCVEVDSSCYAIPQPSTTARWAAAVPSTFRFHFKAFAVFCGQAMTPETLPSGVRAMLPQGGNKRWLLQHMPSEVQDKLWDMWHAAIAPVIKAGMMGCVLFQFQLSFLPSADNMQLLRNVRKRLNASVQMAVEFRNRTWFTDARHVDATLALLKQLGCCLVASDDLHHELHQKDREQTGLKPGQKRTLMPIALHVTQPAFGYVRVHRRHGTWERKLLDEEIQDWATRLLGYMGALQGPCYFLWGTDWEDAPILNAANLDAALPAGLRFDWKAFLREQQPPKGSLKALFAKSSTLSTTCTPAATKEASTLPSHNDIGSNSGSNGTSINVSNGKLEDKCSADVVLPESASVGQKRNLQGQLAAPESASVGQKRNVQGQLAAECGGTSKRGKGGKQGPLLQWLAKKT